MRPLGRMAYEILSVCTLPDGADLVALVEFTETEEQKLEPYIQSLVNSGELESVRDPNSSIIAYRRTDKGLRSMRAYAQSLDSD